jgi:hypothetical protein
VAAKVLQQVISRLHGSEDPGKMTHHLYSTGASNGIWLSGFYRALIDVGKSALKSALMDKVQT